MNKVLDCMDYIKSRLAAGCVPITDLREECTARSWALGVQAHAKARLGVERVRVDNKWYLRLPTDPEGGLCPSAGRSR